MSSALNVVFVAILARLLTPGDFGAFALLTIFLGVATALIESGFGLALIQRKDTTDEDKSTVFWISLGAATVIAFVLVGSAPLIARFFQLDVLIPLTYILAATVWVSAFGIVERALMVKRMAFKQLTIVKLSALIVSSSLATLLAKSGFGVFSLAWQGFASAALTSILLWALSGWRPKLVFRVSSARRLFAFGGYLLASRLLDVIYSKTYTLLIGKFFGTVELGYFNRAESTSQLVSGLVSYPISQVAFPAFSKMDGDPDRIRRGLQGAVRLSIMFNSVAMLTLVAAAEPFVLAILGPQWGSSIPFLQVLALGALLMPLHVLNLHALMAIGRSDLFFLLEVIKKAIGVAVLILASHWGTIGIAWGLVVAGLISFLINAWYSGIHLNYGPIRQTGEIVPSLAFGAAAAFAAHLAMAASGFQSALILLIVGSGTAAAVSITILALAWSIGYDLTGLLVRARPSQTIDKGNRLH